MGGTWVFTGTSVSSDQEFGWLFFPSGLVYFDHIPAPSEGEPFEGRKVRSVTLYDPTKPGNDLFDITRAHHI